MAKCQSNGKGWDSTNWDLNTQQPHGGQEWSTIANFVEDFSVTTNYLGPPRKAIAACATALQHIEHYPAANFEPAHSDLAAWLQPSDPKEISSRLMLGNGASELIDLVTRIGAHVGDFSVRSAQQYKEYERAALASGRNLINDPAKGNMLAVVNPCNPTGEYLPIEQMKEYIESSCQDHTTVLVDESMQLWRGPAWREDSLVSQKEWIVNLLESRDIRVYIIHSWTKIWSCPGIRLGSVIAPTAQHIADLKKHQVPWSLNVFALEFLSAAIKDEEFLNLTWEAVPRLRARTENELTKLFPSWEFHGEGWLSWLWIDTKDEEVAASAVKLAKAAGVPIRNGGMGYGVPTFIRLKVASSEKQDILINALKPLAQ
eukprot:CAMPEP_0204270826 /NCGR_PEP_ID=MMETSP0468-20130131/19111_1 /ASSEMBLY_ACC=CAM_ASM_000383 /TAXON_ID=2969 /ORGANISM="Oxyrrhis marina" /LENGTH=371 /DNA_ID=CAMNT_0051246405 /DNA_START=43 /DNA_END=1158 /DNA_ORIENTATION=-